MAALRIGLDIRPLTASPYSGMGRQALALYNTLRLRPDTEAMPFTSAPLTHLHRTWAFCPTAPCRVEELFRPMARYRFEHDFLPEAISGLGVDVYIATCNKGLPLGLSDVRRKRTKWVLLVHDLFELTERQRRGLGWDALAGRWFDRYTIAHAVDLADAIWVPSEFTAHAVTQRFPQARGRIRILHDAVPFDPWQRLQQEVYTPERYWLVVGTHARRKNVPWFIDAWQKARELWPGAIPQLVVIGHPRDVKVVPPQVRFVHGINDGQLGNWYRQAERVWHPAKAEGFGLPVIEAAACGTPVATAYGSALDEVTPPGVMRFDPHDTSALVQLMFQAATEPPLRAESPEALQSWARGYDLPVYAARLDEFLDELQGERH
ncbi:MAG: glycosyltransferase family 1 protein [Aquabacterium sp.]